MTRCRILLLCGLALLTCAAAPVPSLTDEQERLLLKRRPLLARVSQALAACDWEDGAAASKEALALTIAAVGPWHQNTERVAFQAAFCSRFGGRFADEEAYLRVVLEARLRLYGVEDWRVRDTRQEIAEAFAQQARTPAQRQALSRAFALTGRMNVQRRAGRYAEAEAAAREAVALRRPVLGEAHPLLAESIGSLASIRQERGDLLAALPAAIRAAEVIAAGQGTSHPNYAVAINNLGYLHLEMGDLRTALDLFRRSLAIRKAALGTESTAYALALNNLAAVLGQLGRHREARVLSAEALTRTGASMSPAHPEYAIALGNLAMHTANAGDPAAALPLARRALALSELQGGDNPQILPALNNYAVALSRNGAAAEALPHALRSLSLAARALGPRHPRYADALLNLAGQWRELGRPSAAVPAAGQAVRVSLDSLDVAFTVQSERQQHAALQSARHFLDMLLSIPETPAALAFGRVLEWKGAAFALARKRRVVAALQSADGPAARAAASLRVAAAELAASAGRRQEEAARRKERREAELSALSADFLRTRPPTPEALAAALPPDAVLIDYLFHSVTNRRHLSAFVSRRGRPVARVHLGPAGPALEAAGKWRSAVLARRGGLREGCVLARLIWAPLEAHLKGAKTVLISPDGPLGTLPFAALPGRRSGTFLIEDVAVALVPVPRILPEMLALDRPPDDTPSLLAVGDVDFGTPREGVPTWAALPGTAAELADVRRAFARSHPRGRVTALSAGDATREAVREALPKARHAHLATHGFFAPATARGADAGGGWHPLLLSGLVLSGANRDPKEGEEGGILTALEVSEMDLSKLDLAVLSACETGLGAEAAGEGLLGLQRAFAVAGARTVVASLWKVDDRATKELMSGLSARVWDAKKPLARADALRQAQLALLHGGVKKGIGRGLDPAEDAFSGVSEPRLPPYYWAAFVLSGDWR